MADVVQREVHMTRFVNTSAPRDLPRHRFGRVCFDVAQQVQECSFTENAQQKTRLDEILLVQQRF